jgi:hypothetical protein
MFKFDSLAYFFVIGKEMLGKRERLNSYKFDDD